MSTELDAKPICDPIEVIEGIHLYKRAETIDLQDLFVKLDTETQYASIVNVHVYCDTLTFSPTKTSTDDPRYKFSEKTSVANIQIYARCLLKNPDGFLTALNLTAPHPITLAFVAQESGELLTLRTGNAPGEGTAFEASVRNIPPGKVGWNIRFDPTNGVSGSEITHVRPSEYEDRKLLQRLDTHPSPLPTLFQSYLRSVLDGEFFRSTMVLTSGGAAIVTETLSRLRFIARCTKSAQSQIDLYDHVAELLSMLDSGAEVGGSFVPELNVNDYISSLKVKLEAAKEFARRIDELKLEKHVRDVAQTLLSEMGRSARGFVNDLDILKEDLEKASTEVDNIKQMVDQAFGDVTSAQKLFQAGIKEYIDKKKQEQLFEIIKAGLEVVVAIGVTVITYGAAAPATLEGVALVVKGLKTAVTTWTKVLDALKKIAKVIQAVGPHIASVVKSIAKANGLAKLIAQNIKFPAKVDELLKQAFVSGNKATTQFLLLEDKWQEFELHVNGLFSGLKDTLEHGEEISGADAYQDALNRLIIRSKVMLRAQKAVEQASTNYIRSVAESCARATRERALLDHAAQLGEDSKRDELFKQGLEGELNNIKYAVYVTFQRCLLAYIYYDGRQTGYPIHVTPTLSVAQFLLKVSELDDKLQATKKHLERVQKLEGLTFGADRDGTPDPEGGDGSPPVVFPQNWRMSLLTSGCIFFELPLSSYQTENWYRLRIIEMQVTFQGLTIPKDWNLPISIYLGPQFHDKTQSPEHPNLPYYLGPSRRLQSSGHNPSRAQWHQTKDDYINPALGCKGRLYIKPKDRKGFNWESVSKIMLEITCEGIPLDT